MRILSWNIQSGLGCDGIRDVSRIINYLEKHQQADILCLQEVARNIPDYCPVGQPDQLIHILEAFPEYQPVWGSGMRWYQPGQPPQEFGNLTLVKGIVLDSRSHCLPMPPGEEMPQLPRIATEAVVSTFDGPLRVLNTHLAYHNMGERRLQIDHICRMQRWAEENDLHPPMRRGGGYANRYRTSRSILCGDLNFTPESEEYLVLCSSPYRDAWAHLYGEQSHPATCGVHDHQAWPNGPHCRDYFWISAHLTTALKTFTTDRTTQLSDHQPIILTFDIRLTEPDSDHIHTTQRIML